MLTKHEKATIGTLYKKGLDFFIKNHYEIYLALKKKGIIHRYMLQNKKI